MEMQARKPVVLVNLLALFLASSACWAASESSRTSEPTLSMSQGLLELFQAEMRELLTGTQAIAVAIPVADWHTVITVSHKMGASYVLEKDLTEAEQRELAALPQQFKELDGSFHARTDKLAKAAIERDAEAVAWQFSRLLENCAACHMQHAKERFPNFRPEPSGQHLH